LNYKTVGPQRRVRCARSEQGYSMEERKWTMGGMNGGLELPAMNGGLCSQIGGVCVAMRIQGG
jgi:hypothetical protein